MKKHLCILTVLIMLTLTLCSCNKDTQVTKQGFYFDTVINITVDKKHLPQAEEAFSMCSEMENTFSRTKEDSELYNINQNKISELSDDMYKVIDFSLSAAEKSDGAFDITVAPLCDLWNIKERTAPPTDSEISDSLKNVSYKNITLSPFSTGNSQIDLGAVAKGYAADCIRDLFVEKGINKAIIDLGGNVALIGEYTVGIRNPFEPDSLYARITLKDKSAVTSGAYQRYFEHNGTRYHHIIDPRTGKCANSGLASVTVISPSSMQADALSTAIYVMGEKGLSLCNKYPDTDALLITENGDIITTEGFEEKYSLVILDKQ